jgi:hypothetical protein
MKKIFIFLIIGMIVLAAGGVFAADLRGTSVEDVVKNVVEKKGVNPSQIKDVKKVDFKDLPDEVNIENIDDTNVALYEVDYGEDKPVYVLTVSEEAFEQTIEEIITSKMLINFGYSGEIFDSTFLKTTSGVETDYGKGYVMMRDGSITGISTNIEVLETQYGEIELIIFINGEEVGFRNSINVNSVGVKSDYDVQSENLLTFEAGDVISVYAQVDGAILAQDIITMIEIVVEE